MASSLGLSVRILRALWRSGWLRLTPWQAVAVIRAFGRCGRSFATLAAIAAARCPQRCALVDEQGPLTFGELAARAEALAADLYRSRGVRVGSQTALLCRNRRHFVIALVAVSRLGAGILILGTEVLAPALRRILASERVDLLLHDAEFTPLLTGCVPPERLLDVDRPSSHGAVPNLPRLRRAGQLAVLTSGSTGRPKGVRRQPTLASLLPALAGLIEGLPLAMHQPVVLAIPLCHGYGVATLAVAMAFAAPVQLARRPDIAPLLSRCPNTADTVLVSIPTLLHRWLREGEPAPTVRWAAIVTGSAPLEAGLSSQLLDRFGPVLFNLYGSTEAGVIAMAVPFELREAPGTVGRPLPATAVRLLDATGQPVVDGDCGRVHVRGPLVVQADATGWFDTGDLGRRDAHGRLFVCGRADDMFVSGGERVYPGETEAALAAHPGLLDVAVAVMPDAEFGGRMVAWVVPVPAVVVDESGLREWLRKRIERYKLPRRIHVVPCIPRNALGKVERLALAALTTDDAT